MKALIPLPHCETCGKPCKRRWRIKGIPTKYCSNPCVPRQLRAAGGSKGRKAFIVRTRLTRYRSELQRLQALEKITAQELVATFAIVEGRGWDNGYATCEDKWLNRTGQSRHRGKDAA